MQILDDNPEIACIERTGYPRDIENEQDEEEEY